jgi:hypothetical protein
MPTKTCSRCREAKPLSAFYNKQAAGSGGRTQANGRQTIPSVIERGDGCLRPNNPGSIEDLMKGADEAMYEVKDDPG